MDKYWFDKTAIYYKEETIHQIKNEMKKRSITQKDLAWILHRTEASVSRKLNGNRDFTFEELLIISTVFDMDLLELVKYKVVTL